MQRRMGLGMQAQMMIYITKMKRVFSSSSLLFNIRAVSPGWLANVPNISIGEELSKRMGRYVITTNLD